jgi:hypothetical protein
MINELFNSFLGISKFGFFFGLVNILGYYAIKLIEVIL